MTTTAVRAAIREHAPRALSVPRAFALCAYAAVVVAVALVLELVLPDRRPCRCGADAGLGERCRCK